MARLRPHTEGMRPFVAALVALLLSAGCNTVEPDDDGFAVQPMMDVPPEPTECGLVVDCMIERCDDLYFELRKCTDPSEGDEPDPGCQEAIEAEIETCVEACADDHPDATDEDVDLAAESMECRALTPGPDCPTDECRGE